jgi:hypothetical protein
MPNVPNVPGVPPLTSYIANTIAIVAQDLISLFIPPAAPQWGLFLDGASVVTANSVASFEYKQDWPISDYPVEEGGFQSYDKVQLPFDVRVRFVSGGSEFDRQSLLDSVDAAANTLDLYDVLTPEALYESCSITHYDYQRTAVNGVGMIVVDVWLVQIRVTSTATFTNTQSPGTAGQQGLGNVQTQQPTTAQQALAGGALSNLSSGFANGGTVP